MDNILIVSLRPLEPVKSGFQNTVYLLNEALKKKFNSNFLLIENENDIDPVFGLNYSTSFDKKLDEAIIKYSPKFIFVNTILINYNSINIDNLNFTNFYWRFKIYNTPCRIWVYMNFFIFN
jgi:hypothetical protein